MNTKQYNPNHLQNLLLNLKSSGANKDDILNAVNDIYSAKENSNDKDNKNNNSNSISASNGYVD